MNITTKIVPLSEQRYVTLGDYYVDNEELKFVITETGSDVYNKLVLIHELIEELMTSYRGIKEEDILKWDLQNDDSNDPGREEGCPYKQEHIFAEMVERMICCQLGIDWEMYENYLENVCDI